MVVLGVCCVLVFCLLITLVLLLWCVYVINCLHDAISLVLLLWVNIGLIGLGFGVNLFGFYGLGFTCDGYGPICYECLCLLAV